MSELRNFYDNVFYKSDNNGNIYYITNKDKTKYFTIINHRVETNCIKWDNFVNKKKYWLMIFKYIYDLVVYGTEDEKDFANFAWAILNGGFTSKKIAEEIHKIYWYWRQINFGYDKPRYDDYLMQYYYVEGHVYPNPIKLK